MSPAQQISVPIAELSYRVLQRPADEATPQSAVKAVQKYLGRERPSLAGSVVVGPGAGAVVLRTEAEPAEALLHETRSLLTKERGLEPEGEVEVEASEFAIETDAPTGEEIAERETLRSDVRYFPYPECQWFEIAGGQLVLTERRVVFEPELVIMEGGETEGGSGAYEVRLNEIEEVYRGEWWDVPCLMIETERQTLRYGWAERREEPEFVFDVDEWLQVLRPRIEESE